MPHLTVYFPKDEQEQIGGIKDALAAIAAQEKMTVSGKGSVSADRGNIRTLLKAIAGNKYTVVSRQECEALKQENERLERERGEGVHLSWEEFERLEHEAEIGRLLLEYENKIDRGKGMTAGVQDILRAVGIISW